MTKNIFNKSLLMCGIQSISQQNTIRFRIHSLVNIYVGFPKQYNDLTQFIMQKNQLFFLKFDKLLKKIIYLFYYLFISFCCKLCTTGAHARKEFGKCNQ